MPHLISSTPTIGVFDSGFGGLTVLRALLDRIPNARYLFLGDSARLPYGSKSPATVARFAVSASRFLLDHGADLLVIACNTATALALPEIRAAAAPTPVVGVIEPGALAAKALATTFALNGSTLPVDLAASALTRQDTPASRPRLAQSPHTGLNAPSQNSPRQGRGSEPSVGPRAESPNSAATSPTEVLVLATAATVASSAYSAALHSAGLTPHEKACPLFVPLVEEGWTDHPVTAEVARIYLAEALALAPRAGILLLGCTHYPLLAPLLAHTTAEVLHHPLHLVDSAGATAEAVCALLPAIDTPPASCSPNLTIYATDSVAKFQRLGSHFLGLPLPPVRLVDLGP